MSKKKYGIKKIVLISIWKNKENIKNEAFKIKNKKILNLDENIFLKEQTFFV